MQYTGKIDLFEKAWELALDQYQSSPKLKALIQAMVKNGQPFEHAIDRFTRWANIDEAEGEWLDILGSLRNFPREAGESDSDYRQRLKSDILVDNSGTPDNVIDNARELSGDEKPQYMDEDNPDDPLDVAFFVYTPNGRQILQAKVRKLAPAGVLGIAGAAIGQGDGSLLADADGKLFLMAAEDANIGTGSLLVAESDGTRLVAEDGVTQLIPEA
ncbi:DUF2612 domain-containing protein [Hallerella succinigenes]|uniref:Uncharacterized protein DUF2612 n=1 Tax=Hallerella succinigenes TaxID=1896222 RepID=A0A2M9A9V7_9BACT|nr:DUF2612 domain-containing protein [Hallerella succinigenes]PJJ42397.1 uncharacterized protein DUF2612 [Hallerella succinigenes]